MTAFTVPEQAADDDRRPLAPSSPPPPGSRRGWAAAGVLAALAGATSIGASLQVGAVYDPETAGDAEAIVAALADQVPQLLVFHVATVVCVLLLVVFAAGLLRRLSARTPAHSLAPLVATAGLGLVAVAGLMGSALNTEFIFGVQDPELIVPEAAAFYGHWVGTVPWLWVGAGLSGVALAVAALRHGAAPRWIGWTSAVLGAVTVLVGVSPLQYLAGMVGPLWLLVVSAGFLLGDRRA